MEEKEKNGTRNGKLIEPKKGQIHLKSKWPFNKTYWTYKTEMSSYLQSNFAVFTNSVEDVESH